MDRQIGTKRSTFDTGRTIDVSAYTRHKDRIYCLLYVSRLMPTNTWRMQRNQII